MAFGPYPMDYGAHQCLSAVGWYCPCTAQGPPKRLFLQKNVCCPLFHVTRREVQECWNSVAAAQVSVHHLSFGFQVQHVPLCGAPCSVILRDLRLS